MLILTALVIRANPNVSNALFDTPVTIVEFGGAAVYVGVALRTVYGERPLAAWAKGVLLGFSSYFVLHAYRFILFFTTLYAA